MPFLVLYFRFSRATSGALSRALLSVFSCNFWCSTFVFLVQLLVPFLVLYFRFSRATSGALSRALLSVFSCNFWCSTFVFLVQLLVLFLVLFLLLLVLFHVLFGPTSFDYLSPDSTRLYGVHVSASLLVQLLVLFLVLHYILPLLKKAQGTAEKLAQENCLNSEFLMIPILCFSLCSTFVFLMPLLVLYFQFSRATSGALLLFFSCNFWCPSSCSTFGFLVQLLVPFLVLYFRFSRATSGALSRALLSVFSCNFWCPFSCSTFGFLVQLLVPFLVQFLVPLLQRIFKKKEKNTCASLFLLF